MRVILLALSTAIFVTISYEAMPIGLLTDIATHLHTDTAGGGLLVSSYALVVVIGSIPLSAAVARYDARVVLLAMLVVFALSSALVAASTTLAVAVAARLLGGAAHAIIFTAVFRIALAVVARERRGRAAGTVAAGNAVALSLGLPAATALGAATSWRLPFGVAAAAFVLIAAVATLVVPARLPATEPDPSATMILAAVRRPSMLRVGITVVLTTGAQFATYTYIQPILVEIGLSAGQISLILLGYGAAGVVGLLVVTPWVDRRPPGTDPRHDGAALRLPGRTVVEPTPPARDRRLRTGVGARARRVPGPGPGDGPARQPRHPVGGGTDERHHLQHRHHPRVRRRRPPAHHDHLHRARRHEHRRRRRRAGPQRDPALATGRSG